MNRVRRALSAVKAGGLLAAFGGTVRWVGILADVASGRPEDVASGPFTPVGPDPAGALAVLARYGLAGRVPAAVVRHLEAEGARGEASGLPPAPDTRVLATPADLARVAGEVALERGVGPVTRRPDLVSSAGVAALGAEIGAFLAGDGPGLWVAAGEVELAVPVEGAGEGGRAQHLALAVLAGAPGRTHPWAFLAAGSDGRDGSGGAGAAVYPVVAADPAEVRAALERFDSGPFHHRHGTRLSGPPAADEPNRPLPRPARLTGTPARTTAPARPGVVFLDDREPFRGRTGRAPSRRVVYGRTAMRTFRIVFMGTPDFAVPVLRALLGGPDAVAAVVTQPDRPKGRGRRLQPPPVKVLAEEAGVEVLQPSASRASAAPTSGPASPSSPPIPIVVAAYGRILPSAVLDLPPEGCVNVHASLLPRWRGASPIQWAMAAGDAESGVSIMQMEEGLDTGPCCWGGPRPRPRRDRRTAPRPPRTPRRRGPRRGPRRAPPGGPSGRPRTTRRRPTRPS